MLPNPALTRRPVWWFPPVGTFAFWVTGFAWVASLEDPPWSERLAFVCFALIVTWRFWLPMGVADRVAHMTDEAVKEAPEKEVVPEQAAQAMPDGIYIRHNGNFRLAISVQIQQQLVMAAQAGHMPHGAVANTVLASINEALQQMTQPTGTTEPCTDPQAPQPHPNEDVDPNPKDEGS
jgi:hypothetical protein